MPGTTERGPHPDGRDDDPLSIGDLADRTGLTTSALRMWEQRYGFPVPQRLPGGHRRYTGDDVALVQRVLSLRDAGFKIEQAVTDAMAEREPMSPSVFATLRERHPALVVQRLKKATLIAMSWAIEDEVVARADDSVLWGAFQRPEFYKPSGRRWQELARVARGVTAFADFAESDSLSHPRLVTLRGGSPMHREWAVVVDSPTMPVALTAFELPGQDDVPDRARIFEATWTLDPVAVRDAARVCARTAFESLGSAPDLAGPYAVPAPLQPGSTGADPAAVTALLTRTASYIDRFVTH